MLLLTNLFFETASRARKLRTGLLCGNDPIDEIDPYGLDNLTFYPAPGTMISGTPSTMTTSKPSDGANYLAAQGRGTNSDEFTVSGHGILLSSGNGQLTDWTSGKEVPLTPQQLADMIKKSKGYTPTIPIKIYNCNGGAGPDSPALELSKLLPNRITASNGNTWEMLHNNYDRNGVLKDVTTKTPIAPVAGSNWVSFQNGASVK